MRSVGPVSFDQYALARGTWTIHEKRTTTLYLSKNKSYATALVSRDVEESGSSNPPGPESKGRSASVTWSVRPNPELAALLAQARPTAADAHSACDSIQRLATRPNARL